MYLYGVNPAIFEQMLYPDALIKRKELAKKMVKKLLTKQGEVTNFEEYKKIELHIKHCISAIKFNEGLLNELRE
jgi:hypothetical protein